MPAAGGVWRARFVHAARTAVAAVASMLAAKGLRLPMPYWAPISTLVVMQSTLGASWAISVQRMAGTVMGAGFGAVVPIFFHDNVIAFGVSLLVMGLLCGLLRIDNSAYRFAGITLAVVMLSNVPEAPWVASFERFSEVTLGIVMGLVVTLAWPEKAGGGTVAK